MTNLFPNKGLIVSCQSFPGEPLHGTPFMVALAQSAKIGGAVGIRAKGAADITAIKKEVGLPVIGLNKVDIEGYEIYITPTLEIALAVHAAGADIVAIDATTRQRPDGLSLSDTIRELKSRGIPVMADVSILEEGLAAEEFGADYISTTLSGYTSYSRQQEAPDLELVASLAGRVNLPIVAEGRINTPDQAVEALRLGASLVVVGKAITRPHLITASFSEQMDSYRRNELEGHRH
ncbi:N-acetylmannosamine-6-phosphate 2-epimerase [Paenibacillus eucommiae]|uniref:Putative N-acetylmannosamine-6-phosphate 2-epimerase n=1 Tax=Paenibacillus eucommiae TaxID=1355755 RepID=A0ABS4J0I3_9BACL|nr:N-acetylmannosamine-6-phosphate 2-epimerase [Paenibacillus eucommiae]MBP1993348.1 N-acylglucosamine-6-phosphate 2-epimerase [Paenibacillus eucommiae]